MEVFGIIHSSGEFSQHDFPKIQQSNMPTKKVNEQQSDLLLWWHVAVFQVPWHIKEKPSKKPHNVKQMKCGYLLRRVLHHFCFLENYIIVLLSSQMFT